MPLNNNNEESAFVDRPEIYHKETIAVPAPERSIGIDTKESIFSNIVNGAKSGGLDFNTLASFTSISQSRNNVYMLLDSMCEDATVAAVLETYAEDATEYNDEGQIVWAESSVPEVQKYVQFLLDSMNVDKHIFKWTHQLCKYGDVYLRLYRESDWKNDSLFDGRDKLKKQLTESYKLSNTSFSETSELNEDVKVKKYSQNDHYVNYLEMYVNPADIFELTKFGKTYAYIQSPSNSNNTQNATSNYIFQNQMSYKFNKNDINIHGPMDYVHACLEDNSSRSEEKVSIITSTDENSQDLTYTVKRGQSLLYNVFKVWRELSLLENSVLLNRVTKSSVVRMISVEVGDMPKEMVGPHLQGIKALIEQKSSLKAGSSISEYTNPGPIENNIYIPTHEGIGAITTSQIGGDVDVKSLADLEYYQNKLFGAFRVPKQYFGLTGDSAGFDAGKSLSIISSRYAKMIKRIQNTMIQALTDAINLLLLDRGLTSYINKFSIRMLAPTTQEELDRRENLSNKVGLTADIMNMLSDIDDTKARLQILKSLLSNILTNGEVIEIIQSQIDKLDEEKSNESDDEIESTDESEFDSYDDYSDYNAEESSFDIEDTDEFLDVNLDTTEDIPDEQIEPVQNIDDMNLPSGEDLGIDLTQNM